MEYGAQLWHRYLTNGQHGAIDRIKKKALHIIYPDLEYDEALDESKLKPFKKRRNDLCVDLIERMMQPSHILHGLLAEQNPNMKSKTTNVNTCKYRTVVIVSSSNSIIVILFVNIW